MTELRSRRCTGRSWHPSGFDIASVTIGAHHGRMTSVRFMSGTTSLRAGA